MKNKKKSHLFYRLTPIMTILFALAITASAFWEWRAAPNSNEAGFKALNKQNYSEAIRKFSQSQQYCETDISARFYLGTAYQGYGWDDEALEEYDTAWNLSLDYGIRAMHHAGRICFQKGNNTKAIQCYDRALKLSPALPISLV